MNYLAHAFLSGSNKELLLGNMIGDFVKGKYYTQYNTDVQRGITFHRHLDSFTDKHSAIRVAKKILRESNIKNAGVFVDIIFDHFLANDDAHFPTVFALKQFTEGVLSEVEHGFPIFTEEMKIYFGYMIKHNWLYNYRFRIGIEKTILGFLRQHPHIGNGEEVTFALFNNYTALHQQYSIFMPDVISWAEADRGENYS